MPEAQRTYLTTEEYLALERQSETKSEYFNGEVFAMSGASEAHNLIVANLVSLLITGLRGRPCKAYPSDMRVQVRATGPYTYPDASVVCGRAEFTDQQKNTLRNPTVVFEVLSPTTESYDRGAKFGHYRTLESLTDYVLISLDEARVEHYARQPADKWLLSVYNGLEAVALLPSIGCELPLADVYDKVELPPAETVTLRIVRERQAEYEDDTYASHPPYPNNDC
jgi:Uma2 family endonuclease